MASVAFSFPGIGAYTSIDIQWSHGISPGICRVTLPVEYLDTSALGIGEMTLSHRSNGKTLTWKDALPAVSSIEYSQRGHLASIPIMDRRWRWQYSYIVGWYNERTAEANTENELIKDVTEKTPRELAELLLDAMGETGYSVSALPNDSRPEMRWEYQRPALELQRLCHSLGCRIVLEHVSNKVFIHKIGEGTDLPINDDLISPSIALAPFAYPKTVRILSAPTLFETRLELEAVGIDTGDDGEIKVLDNLTYNPNDGWTRDHWSLWDKSGSDANLKEIAYAQRSVFRYFRVKDNDFNKKAFEDQTSFVIDNIDQIELLPHTTERDSDQEFRPAKAMGRHCREEEYGQPDGNAIMEWEGTVSIVPEKRLVILSDQCYKLGQNTTLAGDMYVQCAFRMRHNDERDYVRYYSEVDLTDTSENLWTGTGSQIGVDAYVKDSVLSIYRHEDWEVHKDFESASGAPIEQYPIYTPGSTDDSEVVTGNELKHYRDAIVDKYENQQALTGGQGIYRGLHLFELDGKRDYILWSVSTKNPIRTTITMGCLPNPFITDYDDKRRQEFRDWTVRVFENNEDTLLGPKHQRPRAIGGVVPF